MSDVTRILSQIEQGDGQAAEQLLPFVYEQLRKLAAEKMAREKPGQTLQATALVHEAYIRLVDVEKAQHWNSRGHFFGAAAAQVQADGCVDAGELLVGCAEFAQRVAARGMGATGTQRADVGGRAVEGQKQGRIVDLGTRLESWIYGVGIDNLQKPHT